MLCCGLGMTDPQAVEKRGGWKNSLPGLLVSGGAIFLLSYLIDFETFLAALRLVDFNFLPLVALLFIGTLVARAIGWRAILQEKVTIRRAFWTVNEGYLFNNVLPFRLGEVARAFLLNKTSGISFWEVLSTIMIERIFDIAILAGVLLGTIPFVIGAEWALQAAYGAMVIVLVGFGILFWLARHPAAALSLFARLTRPWPRLADFGRDKLDNFLNGLTALREVSKFLKVFFWILLAWAFNISWYAVLLSAFHIELNLISVVFVIGAIALGVSAPSSPAFIGVFEAAAVGALALFGIDYNLSLAYAVTAHSVYFVITVVFGAYALGKDGQSLGGVYRGLRSRQLGKED